MTRTGTYVLTAIAAGLFVFLNWAFADGLFKLGDLWTSETYSSSTVFTYLMLAAIILAGVYQARSIAPDQVVAKAEPSKLAPGQTDDPAMWKFIMGNVYFALIWLPIRFFIGREWLSAGEHKLRDSAWMDGGSSLQGYWERAVAIPDGGRPAITYGWYREFLQYMLDNEWYTWFAKLIAVGEFLVGVALIVGALVGIAAFFGTLMNFSFMLAGSSSTNPVLFGLSVLMVLAWKVAGYWGLDRYLLPMFGAPWSPGRVFRDTKAPATARTSTA
jgi:thiosulfate dehydrogenase [quinone] large subunit